MEKGDFVVVQGLNSKAGMKLNGAYALVLGKCIIGQKTDQRYPIQVFALRGEEKDGGVENVLTPILVDAPKNKIKVENLESIKSKEKPLNLFRNFALSHIASSHELDEFRDNKHIHFLIDQCRKHFPDDLETAIYYAKLCNLEGGKQKKLDQAAKALEKFVPRLLDESFEDELTLFSCYEDVSELYKEFCSAFIVGGEPYLQNAFDCAMKMCCHGMSCLSAIRIRTALDTLQFLQEACASIISDNPIKDPDPKIAGFLVQSAEMAIKIQSNGDKDPYLLGLLASAYGLVGDFEEASKLNRKALAMDMHKHPGLAENQTSCLVLSQMRCKGMPLEDAFVLSATGSKASCILKADAKNCFMSRPVFPGGPQAIASKKGAPKVFYYALPKDPNDPEVFPAWLLELTKPDEEDEE